MITLKIMATSARPLWLFILPLICFHCDQDSEPIVITFDPEVHNNLVTFTGVAQSPGITEYGFLMDVSPELDLNDAIIRSNGDPGSGPFYGTVSKLESGATYYMQAFITIGDDVFTGETRSFVFRGIAGNTAPEIEPPTISGISPTTATFEEQITVHGKGFKLSGTDNQVKFGAVTAEIISATNTTLVVKVPTAIQQPTSTISVNVDSVTVDAPTLFQLTPPIVSGMSPSSQRVGEKVKITGANFNPVKELNEVFFQGIKAKVVSSSASELKVEVPEGVFIGLVQLRIAGTTVDVGIFVLKVR